MDQDTKIAALKADLDRLRAKRAAWANGLGTADPTEFHLLGDQIAQIEQFLKDLGVADV